MSVHSGIVRGARAIAGVLAAAAISVGWVQGAGAAVLKAEYRFQGDLASEVEGAPRLFNLGKGNRFAFERIDGLGLNQVLRFPQGNGLSLAAAGLVDPNANSEVIVFRFAHTHGYRRILDFTGGALDYGLYNLDGHVALYGGDGGHDTSQNIVIGDSYIQIALTTAAAPEGSEQATAYVNGVQVAGARIARGFDLGSGELRFFRDNATIPFPGEESSGAVSCVLVYDGTLSAGEVSQVASDPSLCPAPKSGPGRPKASVTGRPKAAKSRGSIAVDTGLAVSCPIGAKPCRASGRVYAAPTRPGGRARLLGVARLSVPAGERRNVAVRLRRRAAMLLRDAGTLKVLVSAQIETAEGRTASARQAGRIKAPQPPAFQSGAYSGTTSQNLPITIGVQRTTVRSVSFRWRGTCSDGKTHTGTVFLGGRTEVHHGRFSLKGRLNSGGTSRVSGHLKGVHASGVLSRTGASASGVRCAVEGIGWHARTSPLELGATSG